MPAGRATRTRRSSEPPRLQITTLGLSAQTVLHHGGKPYSMMSSRTCAPVGGIAQRGIADDDQLIIRECYGVNLLCSPLVRRTRRRWTRRGTLREFSGAMALQC